MSNDGDIRDRLAKLEIKQDLTDKKIDKMDSNTELLFKMSVVLEQQVIANNKQSEQIEKMDETFNKINENLILLNSSHNNMKSEFGELKEEVNVIKSDIISEKQKDNISVVGILKKGILWWVVLPLTLIGSWIAKQFGF